jgi:two-component system, chemotaxis family, chemotaxis protein CheY
MLREILTLGGHAVVGEACNGVEAVEQYRRLRPDLVVMDIVMPLRSGIEALQDIMTEDPQALVVMCSALGQEALLLEAAIAEARAYIIKPFQKSEVLMVIDRTLAGTARLDPELLLQGRRFGHEQGQEVDELAWAF